MDLQKMMDGMSEMSRLTRSEYHLTLGKLIAKLEGFDKTLLVEFDGGGCPGDTNSYRGYYSDLAFDTVPNGEVTVLSFLAQARDCLGKTFTGYKGGDFTMQEDTPLWNAEYGCGGGPAIMGIKKIDGRVIIFTKEID